MRSYTVSFIRYLLGLRDAETSLTLDEQRLLSVLAKGKNCIVEVGVYEGATSKILCQSMNANGRLYLVDPYFHLLKIEKLFNFSCSEFIAKRSLKRWKHQVEFVRKTSVEAARFLLLRGKVDLIFIDAKHGYESVFEDFKYWSTMLSPDGVIAFHDSRICKARPDLTNQIGSVRLVNEIIEGKHNHWQVISTVDSLTAISRAKSIEHNK